MPSSPKAKKQGVNTGRVAVRSTGNFNIKTEHETVQGIHAKYCQLIQRTDGYHYHTTQGAGNSSST